MSWTKLLCLAVRETWGHTTQHQEAYHSIYERDGHRCSNPLCSSRQVRPHHIKFRSVGGSDEDTSDLCGTDAISGASGSRARSRISAANQAALRGEHPVLGHFEPDSEETRLNRKTEEASVHSHLNQGATVLEVLLYAFASGARMRPGPAGALEAVARHLTLVRYATDRLSEFCRTADPDDRVE